MIRILFDEQGDSHGDIFLKIDAVPSFHQVADLYFLGDFLGSERKATTKEKVMIEFIEYIKRRILSAGKEEIFIPIDLSDQYVGGLLISKKNEELVKVKYVWTENFYGFGISLDLVDQMVSDDKPDFNIERDWLISTQEIIKGLDWSKRRIQIIAQHNV